MAQVKCEFCGGTFTPDRRGHIGWHTCIDLRTLTPQELKEAAQRTFNKRTRPKVRKK